MKCKFRLAKPGDFDAMAALINQAYRSENSGSSWTTEAHLLTGTRASAKLLQDHFEAENSVLVLALAEDGRLAGCVHLEKRGNNCYLGLLSVSHEFQNQGVGRALLDFSESFARETFRSERIEMTVIPVREELLAWYKRRGYERTGKVIPFPFHLIDGEVKVKDLSLEILDKEL